MLSINALQIKRLSESRAESFRQNLLDHLLRSFPGAADRPICVAVVDAALRRAPDFGVETEHAVALLATLMLAFGEWLDTDGRHPWATQVLQDCAHMDPYVCLDRLYDAAVHTMNMQA